jgi:phosphomethylpyrimidine kinase
MNTVLTIAGSDSCGGAGIQADLKTFAALRTYGLSVITAVTAQNTCGVMAIREMDREIIQAQMDAIYADIPVAAVKIGMLSSREIVCVVAAGLARYRAEKVVLDPVMLSKSGRSLLSDEAVASLKTDLIPQACVVTPNLPEAEALAGFAVTDEASMLRAAKLIYEMGAKHVVIKGGHLKGAAADLFYDGKTVEVFSQARLIAKHTHGTGCTFSSAIAAGLAKGLSVRDAVVQAKAYITMTIAHGFVLGKGVGPMQHFYGLYEKAGKC